MALLSLGVRLLALVAPAVHPGALLGVGSPGTIAQIVSGTEHTCVLYGLGLVKWCAARARPPSAP